MNYEGPPALAVSVATAIADAAGVELKSAKQPQPLDGPVEGVLLSLTVEGTEDAVRAAVEDIEGDLPPGATITVESAPG